MVTMQDTRLTMLADQGWKWMVRCYYGPNGAQPGKIAIETVHKDDQSKDLEVSVGESRPDIGVVDVIRL